MEKITLTPRIKELIYKNNDDGVHFDVLAYHGAGNQEKTLGSLFVLGHIKYPEENLSYIVSLVSSLAKREYYSDASLQEQNAKHAFERMLKKINEVLGDFFQNKNFTLDIGLTAISGENIYISRLGKFKIALARENRYIDVLNNIDLFSKEAGSEKQFSNIISGKVKFNDKIFAYFPFRSITSREKQLKNIFVEASQDEFSQKIAHLSSNANNFSCCGVHIDMLEIKEIPISPAVYSKPFSSSNSNLVQTAKSQDELLASSKSSPESSDDESAVEQPQADRPQQDTEPEQSRIIPAEFLVSRRGNVLTSIAKSFRKLVSVSRSGSRAGRRGFILIAAMILVPVISIAFLKTGDGSNGNTLKQAKENIKLAQSRITQSNFKDARSLLQASLISLADSSDKKAETTKQQVNQILDGLDRVEDKQAALFANLSELTQNQNFRASFIASSDENSISAVDANGLAFSVTQSAVSSLGQFKTTPQFLFSTPSAVSVFNGSDVLGVYDIKPGSINMYSLKEPAPATDAALYESDLYTLSDNTIYKYSDAITGGTKRATWTGRDETSGNLLSVTIDGNVYVLTSDGRLIKFFKGKKEGELDLQISPSSGSRIFTFKDSAFIYLTDKANRRVYVFDKLNGALKISYKLDAAGTPQDISISADGTVWILSADNKIWVIR